MARGHSFRFFFFNDTATTEIYTLSLHDALPICGEGLGRPDPVQWNVDRRIRRFRPVVASEAAHDSSRSVEDLERSEEHTSELQSPCNIVCRLLLEKKKARSARKPATVMPKPLPP